MIQSEFDMVFWPKLRGLWPQWEPSSAETVAWAAVMRQYTVRAATCAVQPYWQEESSRPKPRPSEFVKHLRFQPEADNRSDEQREFEASYHQLGPIAQRVIALEMCRRRLVRNRYDDPRERERDERLVVTLQSFWNRQSQINSERLAAAEQEADVMLARIRRSVA